MTEPRIVVVTGASRGIGRSIALRFAREGDTVWALARSREHLEALKAEAGPGEIRPLPVDMADAGALEQACGTILASGVPSVLVNNAGIALSATLAKTSLEDFERTQAINVRAPWLLSRALMPAMAKAGGGRVINIASTAALKGFRYTSAYCASKHALLGLTRSLAVEYAAKKVTVNALCPGWTDTDMLAQSADNISRATGRSQDEAREILAKMNPMGTLIRPEDVAELCFVLASPTGATVTGAAWTVDGGEAA